MGKVVTKTIRAGCSMQAKAGAVGHAIKLNMSNLSLRVPPPLWNTVHVYSFIKKYWSTDLLRAKSRQTEMR